jgi:DNA-binding transcriptional MerR regulator
VALYGPQHAERLRFIDELQSRGLTLRGIKDLTAGQASDNEPLEAWLDLDRMRAGWLSDPPQLMSRTELEEMVGEGGARDIARLLEVGAIDIDECGGSRRYRVSPALVGCALFLESEGIALEVSTGVHSIIENHFVAAARDVIDFLYRRRGDGFGDSDHVADVHRAIEAIFPQGGSPFVQLIFARAVDQALGEWLESPKQLAKKARPRDAAKRKQKAAKEGRREKKKHDKRRRRKKD